MLLIGTGRIVATGPLRSRKRSVILATVSLLLPLAVLGALIPIADTGAGVDFGTPRAYGLGALLAAASIAGAISGLVAVRGSSNRAWRLTGIAGSVLGVSTAMFSMMLLWLFSPS